jgi:hypothetical protein
MFTAQLTGKRMVFNLLFSLGLTLLAPALFGSPVPCPIAPLTTYEASGYQCLIEGYTLDDFTFSDSQTGGATLLTPSQITVNPSFSTPDSVSFQFFGAFSAASGQTAEYIVQYNLDPLLPKITGQGIDLGPSDPVNLTGQFCGNGLLVGPYISGSPTDCSGTNPAGIFPLTLFTSGDSTIATGTFATTVTTVDTRLILDLVGDSNTTYFGTNADIIPTEGGGGGPVSGVPEPSTSLWLVPGMFAALWLRKKWLANER